MGIRRKDALKHMRGFALRVQIHLEKIAANPDHPSIRHWKREIRGWLMQMEELLPQIGKKTGSEWATAISIWRIEMEHTDGY
jgi:hypothetical protein